MSDIKITPIVELDDVGELIQSIVPEASVKKVGRFESVVQSFLIQTPEKNILVDSCNGNDKERKDMPEWGNLKTDFLQKLESVGGVKPEEIDIVVNTHLHFDHVGWNTILVEGEWVPTFANARYLFVQEELEYWLGNPVGEIDDDLQGIEDSVRPILNSHQEIIVSSDHKITPNIRLLPALGHTPGHVCVEVSSDSGKTIIGGDLIYHPTQVENMSWTAESDHDPQQVVQSRREIFNYIVNESATLKGMHFQGDLVLGKEISGGNYKIIKTHKNNN